MSKSTRKSRSRKAADRPKKPYPAFPLTPHASGAWQKKIRGKIHYFGRWAKTVNGKRVRIEGDGRKAALELYKAQADDLHAGRSPESQSQDNTALMVKDLCNHFLTAKKRRLDAGRMTARSFAEYKATTDRLTRVLGYRRLVENLRPADFDGLLAEIGKTWGLVREGNEITRVKSVFKFGRDNGLSPVRYCSRCASA